MSLQVWLPLTKDTRQQGLSNISVTGTPASWGNGKLGKCATWNGAVANIIYNNTTDFNYTENFSVAMWINPIYTGSTGQYVFTVGRADAGGYGYGLQITSATQAVFRFGNRAVSFALASNEWNHVVMTVDTVNVIVYKNGTQVATNTIATKPTYSDGNGMGLGCFHYSGNIYPYYGSLNDFRIYDHCLSPMEVKELAKGLVLHYPLNRQGWGQENLLKNSEGEFTSKSSVLPIELTTDAVSNILGKTVQISADIKTETNGSNIDAYIRSDASQVMSTDVLFSNITTTYKRYTTTVVCNSSGTPKWFAFRTNGNGGSTSGVNFYIKNVKLEWDNQSTPWCPSSEDTLYTTMGLNSTTEYDCSGFCNNGTRTGTFTWTSDTPKYQVSTIFPNGTDYIAPEVDLGSVSELTISFWVKPSSSDGGYATILAYHNAPTSANSIWIAVNCENKSIWVYRGAYIDTNGTLPDDTWSHCVFTYDNGTPAFYINGVPKAVSRQSYTTTTLPLSGFNIGNSYTGTTWNTKFYGGLSDFRIYATALSADDVKSLYQNCATIDPDGTIRGQIRS